MPHPALECPAVEMSTDRHEAGMKVGIQRQHSRNKGSIYHVAVAATLEVLDLGWWTKISVQR